jgi:hypothetical protein
LRLEKHQQKGMTKATKSTSKWTQSRHKLNEQLINFEAWALKKEETKALNFGNKLNKKNPLNSKP